MWEPRTEREGSVENLHLLLGQKNRLRFKPPQHTLVVSVEMRQLLLCKDHILFVVQVGVHDLKLLLTAETTLA